MGSHKVYVGTLAVTAGTDTNVLSKRELAMARQLIFDCAGEASFAAAVTLYAGVRAGLLFAALVPVRITPTAADVVLIAAKVNVVDCGGFESIALKCAGTDTISIPVYAVLEY